MELRLSLLKVLFVAAVSAGADLRTQFSGGGLSELLIDNVIDL